MRAPRLRSDLTQGTPIKLSPAGELMGSDYKQYYPLFYMEPSDEIDERGFPMVWVMSCSSNVSPGQMYEHSSLWFVTEDGRNLFE